MNNEYKKEIDWAIEKEAMKFALNEDIKEKSLIGMINVYVESFSNFIQLNYEKIKEFSLKNNLTLEEKNVTKIFSFLDSYQSLINKEQKKINKEEFKFYVKLDSKKTKEWEKTLEYAEETMQFKGIKEINNKLQFIISFNDDADLRKTYFKIVLLNKWNENEKIKTEQKTDFRNKENIYETLFQTFQPDVDQHIYTSKF